MGNLDPHFQEVGLQKAGRCRGCGEQGPYLSVGYRRAQTGIRTRETRAMEAGVYAKAAEQAADHRSEPAYGKKADVSSGQSSPAPALYLMVTLF